MLGDARVRVTLSTFSCARSSQEVGEVMSEKAMSDEPNYTDGLLDPGRRNVLRAAGRAAISGIAASTLAVSSPVLAQSAGNPNAPAVSGERNNAGLGARLQGVQHFGVTVQNMDRAFEFYTEVLGGSEVMRD